ncbi:MAG: hypothetical protein IPG91_15210 [Ideonella sp.]|nr:hypothetical protein [Ideonella sp.]
MSKTVKLGPARQAVAEAPGAGPISPRGADGHSVVLAFVRLKQASVLHADLATQLDELEQKAEALLLNHLSFTRNTRNRVKHAFDALRELITPLDPAQAADRVRHPRGHAKEENCSTSGYSLVEYRQAGNAPPPPPPDLS